MTLRLGKEGHQRAFIIVWASAVATLAAVAQDRQIMPSTPDSAPFYQGVTDEASLERIVEARLDRAKRLLQDLLAVSGKRTPENTLRLYDTLAAERANAGLLIVRELHPDPRMRAAAESLLQRIDAVGSDVSLNRGVFDALAAIDLAGASPDVRYYVEQELADYADREFFATRPRRPRCGNCTTSCSQRSRNSPETSGTASGGFRWMSATWRQQRNLRHQCRRQRADQAH
jgi:hypothetical protein